MDSLTQLLLGAAVGYACGGKRLGRPALLIGAVAGTLPDLDFIFSAFAKDDFSYLYHHRGFSHSIIASITLPVLWAWITTKLRPNWNFVTLYAVYFWGAFTHIWLDSLTTWGTQIFWPAALRVAFNTVFIVDPIYTVFLLAGVGVSLFLSMHKKRQWVVIAALLLSSLYLVWGIGVKYYLNPKFEAVFSENNIRTNRISTKPTAFNSILWLGVAESDAAYHLTFVSLIDKTHHQKVYTIPKNQEISPDYLTTKTKQILAYTNGYYIVKKTDKGYIIHDLRYGTLGDPFVFGEQFVFSYELKKISESEVEVTVLNPKVQAPHKLFKALWLRLKGLT